MLSVDYMNDLKKWAVEDYYVKNVHIFELPHTMVSVNILFYIYVRKE